MIKSKIFLAAAFLAAVMISIPMTTDASTDILYANPTEYYARIITGDSSQVRVDFKNTGKASVIIQIGNSPAISLQPKESTYYPLEGNSTYRLKLSADGKNVPVKVSISNGYIKRGW